MKAEYGLKICVLFLIINLSLSVSAKNIFKEKDYQEAYCNLHNGITEYQNSDFTRVDCLTSTHAIEFDFAKKWAESIGQALHYQKMTGKKSKSCLNFRKS